MGLPHRRRQPVGHRSLGGLTAAAVAERASRQSCKPARDVVYWFHQEDGMKRNTDWEAIIMDAALIWSWPALLVAVPLISWLAR